MIVAVDTSALAKLVVEEIESAALRRHLSEAVAEGDEFFVSALAHTELRRLAVRLSIASDRAESVVHRFSTIRLDEGILQLAGRLPHPHLGTLDAIHVATALSIEAAELLTYDQQQADAAAAEGLRVATPGSTAR